MRRKSSSWPIFLADGYVGKWQTCLSLALMLAALLFSMGRTFHGRHFMRDLITIQAGGACLVEHCSPYNTDDLDRVLHDRGSRPLNDWSAQLPVYPPPTLALFAPFHSASVPTVCAGFFYFYGILCLSSGWCTMVRATVLRGLPPWVRAVLFALLFGSSKIAYELHWGNPVTLLVPILVVVCFDTAPSRRGLRIALFCLACLLKPQSALPFLVVLLAKKGEGWRTVAIVLGSITAFTVIVLLWCAAHPATAHVLTDLSRMLASAKTAGADMRADDRTRLMNMIHLQDLIGYWVPESRTLTLLTDASLLLLFGGFGLAFWSAKPQWTNRTVYLLVVAAIATLSLLPVYHRFYDSMVLLLAVPWAAYAWQQRQHIVLAIGVVCVNLLESFHWLRYFTTLARTHGTPHPRSVPDFFLHRVQAIEVFALAVLFTWTLYTQSKAPFSSMQTAA